MNMLVKNVQRYLPASIFEGFIAIESIVRKLNFIKSVKIINAATFIIMKRVFRLIESKKLLFFLGLILYT
jgi:hypothetical protein